jgi:YVTN family beta-propeller protein
VANSGGTTVSVIDTNIDVVINTVNGLSSPFALGLFIGPIPILPAANFSSNTTSGYAPLSVQFNDSSTNATSWNWDFGDGANSTLKNPTHVYSVKGNYTVNLTVSNVNGTNSKTAEITPYSRPYAYIPNQVSNNVSVIDTSNNRVVASVNVGSYPYGVAVNQNGTKVYVTNQGSYTVSVINTTTNTVSATVTGFYYPQGVAVRPDGKKVYVANYFGKNVSVIDTATNTITATVKVGDFPNGIAVNSAGTKVYVTNQGNNNISVIDTSNNTVVASVNVEGSPYGVAVSPDGTKVYAALYANGKVSVIDTSNNTVVASVNVGSTLYNLAVNPEGTKVYVACWLTDKVSVIDTSNNTVVALVNAVNSPYGIAVNPKGTKVYVANYNSNTVSVIDTATNTVTTTVPVGNSPSAFGQFITIGVEPILPVANFSSNVTSSYVPLSVQFTDLSENATALNWNFGDGSNSTQPNPIHTFSAAGNYTVNLTASNLNGTNSKLATINVSAQPVLPIANFSANVTSGYAPLCVQFNDSSTNTTSCELEL